MNADVDLTHPFVGLSPEQAAAFAERWLPAWTGNEPERLAAFYTDDLFYCDPTVPAGLVGKAAFLDYLRTLLRHNPRWRWTHRHGVPMRDGFVNHWHLTAPVGDIDVEVDGVCLVHFRDGLISRNEVYFDPSRLVTAIGDWNARKPGRGRDGSQHDTRSVRS
ncbi:nuclear transport factor 2 family protein [Krasilnikovia sp. MM14-A1259]|uniref:nuclear transport factor 2 family protein n=1 Tax=Krasilnikovia sp. MM14-A1259 TaxID=3373539 RepID=UPI0038182DF7